MPLRKCPYCKGLANFDVIANRQNPTGNYVWLENCQNCNYTSYFQTIRENRNNVADCYPKLDTQIDDELPDNVKTAFKQATEALNNDLWDACVVMARRAIEEAVTELNAKGDDLFRKIDYLEAERKITPELKTWAHETRLGGKLGAHGTNEKKFADKEDAEEILEFCLWFLRYLFTLPRQLAEKKAKLVVKSKPANANNNRLPRPPPPL